MSERVLNLRAPRTLGFTLFEVAISLVILAFGVVSIMALFPSGLKAQQMARFQLYAAAKAEEMIEQFNTAHFDNATADTEGTDLWNIPSSYRSQTWDVDARIASHRYGMMPLPTDLAHRIDSDSDEIQQILSEGGYIYYSQPLASTGMLERSMAEAPPNEAQKLIIGITGYAQENSLPIFGMKNWPYYASFPSPPVHYMHMADPWLPTSTTYDVDYFIPYKFPRPSENFTYCWETAHVPKLGTPIPGTDPDMQKVFDWPEAGTAADGTATKVHYGYFPYACGRQWDDTWVEDKNPADGINDNPDEDGDGDHLRDATMLGYEKGEYPSRESAKRYVQAALWYCFQKSKVAQSGIAPGFWNDAHATAIPGFEPGTPDEKKWMQVQAMRFLSHAATCLTSWYPLGTTAGVENLTDGVRIKGVTLDGKPTGPLGASGDPDLLITNDLIRYYHERCLKLAMTYAASLPYDWAVPRPVERTTIMDHPLLQYDLFSDPLAGKLYGTGLNAKQWHPLAPRPIRNIGLSATYPINQDGSRNKLEGTQVNGKFSNLFGDADHYSLTLPFAASERCRELVFWVVDWQSYEDFETLPSAPLDASRYPVAGPRMTGNGANPATAPRDFNGRMWDVRFVDPHLFCFRNPEKSMLWTDSFAAAQPSGTAINQDHQLLHNDDKDWGSNLERRQVFNGIWGADRNYNKHIDRGRLPKSVRLRAVQVARLNFYDPRLVCLLR